MKKYIFIGNRFPVLQEMIRQDLKIESIFCVKNSNLKILLENKNIPFKEFSSKNELISLINEVDFDVLVSNGCPYILPVSKIKKDGQTFVNIHPSLLPDLKGKSPINGALLFERKHGVTCHLMDDGIDTGEVIAQIELPITHDIDLGLLYKMSFLAEKDVFSKAQEVNFRKLKISFDGVDINPIYYSRKEEDMYIDWNENLKVIVNKIKAFGVKNLCAKFIYKNKLFSVYDCELVNNPYIISKLNQYNNFEVMFKYDWTIVVRIQNSVLKLNGVRGDIGLINEGDSLV